MDLTKVKQNFKTVYVDGCLKTISLEPRAYRKYKIQVIKKYLVDALKRVTKRVTKPINKKIYLIKRFFNFVFSDPPTLQDRPEWIKSHIDKIGHFAYNGKKDKYTSLVNNEDENNAILSEVEETIQFQKQFKRIFYGHAY